MLPVEFEMQGDRERLRAVRERGRGNQQPVLQGKRAYHDRIECQRKPGRDGQGEARWLWAWRKWSGLGIHEPAFGSPALQGKCPAAAIKSDRK